MRWPEREAEQLSPPRPACYKQRGVGKRRWGSMKPGADSQCCSLVLRRRYVERVEWWVLGARGITLRWNVFS